MDPITTAGAYATIVGLICIFKNERKQKEEQNTEHFLAWLEAQRQGELKEFIIRSTELPSEIDKLLKQDTEEILAKLNDLRDSVISLPSRIENLQQMFQATQSRTERLQMLLHLISETERAIRQIEKASLILIRTDIDKEWDVPLDVDTLKEVCEHFRTMDFEDILHHTFVVEESALEKKTITIHREGRLRQRERLLRALQKLIALREELDYLEQETRTPRR